MKKKILIGSIIAVALLLLMPSIPAIQQKTVEEKAYSDFVERLKDVDLEDIEVSNEALHLYNRTVEKAVYPNKNEDFFEVFSRDGERIKDEALEIGSSPIYIFILKEIPEKVNCL